MEPLTADHLCVNGVSVVNAIVYIMYRRINPALHKLTVHIWGEAAGEPSSQKGEITNYLNYHWRDVIAIRSEFLIPWLEFLIPFGIPWLELLIPMINTCSDLIPFVGNAIHGKYRDDEQKTAAVN